MVFISSKGYFFIHFYADKSSLDDGNPIIEGGSVPQAGISGKRFTEKSRSTPFKRTKTYTCNNSQSVPDTKAVVCAILFVGWCI